MSAMSTEPRVRVAPSPTGDPHVGTAYMSLFNLGFARRHGGRFVLRIEDTDRARFQAGSEQQIYDTLHWLGLDWDEGPDVGGPYAPYRQSERLETYQPFVDQLLEAGHAYRCWCSPERLAEMREKQRAEKRPTGYDRLCLGKSEEERQALGGAVETPVVRMLVPDDVPLTFTDVIRGAVSAPRPDDQVILKADGFPTYHLAVVVDDHLMGITHVVRGEEWISSTPKHLLLYSWLGFDTPEFAHMPLLRNADKSKISKRKNPAARLTWFVEQGYLPEALLNFLALLGYGQPDGASEVFEFAQFSADFEWARVNTVGPVFDLTKLDWLNGHYIRELSGEEFAERLQAHARRGRGRRRRRGRGAARGGATGPGAHPDPRAGPRHAALPARPGGRVRRGRVRRDQAPGGEGGAGARRRAARARGAAGLDRQRDRAGPAGSPGGGPGPQATPRLRSGSRRRDGQRGLAAAVRVDGAAGPRAQPGPAARRDLTGRR